MPEQLGDVIGIPILFTLLFTYLFGGALAGSTHDYLQFLLPGTLALAVVFVTVYSGVTLNRDLATVLNSDEAQKAIRGLGLAPAPGTPEAFGQRIRADYEVWGRVVKASGARPEGG